MSEVYNICNTSSNVKRQPAVCHRCSGSVPFLTAMWSTVKWKERPRLCFLNPFIPATHRCFAAPFSTPGISWSICQKVNHHPVHLLNPRNLPSPLHTCRVGRIPRRWHVSEDATGVFLKAGLHHNALTPWLGLSLWKSSKTNMKVNWHWAALLWLSEILQFQRKHLNGSYLFMCMTTL